MSMISHFDENGRRLAPAEITTRDDVETVVIGGRFTRVVVEIDTTGSYCRHCESSNCHHVLRAESVFE